MTVGTGAPLSSFELGQASTGSGTLSVTATAGTTGWTLQAQDGSGDGSMVAAPTGCAGSDATLSDPIQLAVSSSTTGVVSTGTIALSSSAQTVATASGLPALSDVDLTANYTQQIPATERLLTGCAYSITVTFTAQ